LHTLPLSFARTGGALILAAEHPLAPRPDSSLYRQRAAPRRPKLVWSWAAPPEYALDEVTFNRNRKASRRPMVWRGATTLVEPPENGRIRGACFAWRGR